MGSPPAAGRVGRRLAGGRALAGRPGTARPAGRRVAAPVRRSAVHLPLRVPPLEGHLRRDPPAGPTGRRGAGPPRHLERGHRGLPAPELGGGGHHVLRRHVSRRGDRADRAHLRAQGGGLHPAAERRPALRHRRPLREHRLPLPPRRDPGRPARPRVGHRGRRRPRSGGHRELPRPARSADRWPPRLGRPAPARW